MELLPTLASVIVGAFLTALGGIWLTRMTNNHQQQQELQNYRKSLMEQYLNCINEFDLILNRMRQNTVIPTITNTVQQPAEGLANISTGVNELRALVIRASSILKATGNSELSACGWALYQEALNNMDSIGIFFETKEYNPIFYFRVALDVGLAMFAYTISNNLPPSSQLPDQGVNEKFEQHFREQVKNKYKANPNWSMMHK